MDSTYVSYFEHLLWILYHDIHCEEIWIYVFPEKKLCGFSLNFQFLWANYIFPRLAYLFSCSRIGRPIRGIQYINRSQKHNCRNWDCSLPLASSLENPPANEKQEWVPEECPKACWPIGSKEKLSTMSLTLSSQSSFTLTRRTTFNSM